MGAHRRYPKGVPEKVKKLIEHELELIEDLEYEPFFPTVYDVVTYARSRNICARAAVRRRTQWSAIASVSRR